MPDFSCIVNEQISPSMRLDRYISEVLKLLSRSQIKTRNLKAKINGKDVKLSKPVKQNDVLDIYWTEMPPVDIIPENISLDIIYEDKRCIVINKFQGMVVHPGAGNRQGTLANALYFRRLDTTGHESGNKRPGIVHRLDKDTSGVIITALDDETHTFLADQFKTRKVRKNYIAIVQGIPEKTKGCIETHISRDPANRKRFRVSANGKNAVTYYKVIKSWKEYSLLLLRPRTGRTHQLRVHLMYIGHPVLGDPVYGKSDKLFSEATLMLHSKSLVITLPDEKEERVFNSLIPQRFIAVMEKLNRMNING